MDPNASYQTLLNENEHMHAPAAAGVAPLVYQDGICDCFHDLGICCMGTWALGCTQWQWGGNMERSGMISTQGAGCYRLCGMDALTISLSMIPHMDIVGSCASVGVSVYMGKQRYQMRQKYGMAPHNTTTPFCEWARCCECCGSKDEFDDICTMVWCRRCATCQDARLMRHYGVEGGVVTMPHGPTMTAPLVQGIPAASAPPTAYDAAPAPPAKA